MTKKTCWKTQRQEVTQEAWSEWTYQHKKQEKSKAWNNEKPQQMLPQYYKIIQNQTENCWKHCCDVFRNRHCSKSIQFIQNNKCKEVAKMSEPQLGQNVFLYGISLKHINPGLLQ